VRNPRYLVPALLFAIGGWAGLSTHGQCQIAETEEAPVIFEASFNDGLGDWNQHGEAEFAVDTAGPHSGKACARITVAPGTQLSYQQLNRSFQPVKPGDEFRVTLWIRAEGITESTGAYAALQFLDAGGKRAGIFHSKIGLDVGRAGWEQLVIEGKAPEGAVSGQVDLILHALGTAWFDDVRLEKTGELEPWPDLGAAERQITIHTDTIVNPRFGGVGFHVFHHQFPTSQTVLETVVAKRWREINPSFARLNDRYDWDKAQWDETASHLLRMKRDTGTEVYMTTWGPKDTEEGEERVAYAKQVVDNLEYLVRTKGATNVKYYCMTNELSLGSWGKLGGKLPKFKDYHQCLYDEIQARGLDVKLLATDAAPVQRWHTIEWATKHMDEITGVYGGHDYFNNAPPEDERFYPWFLEKLKWGVGLARAKGKDFILGEFGCKQDGRVVDGQKQDRCVYFETPREPLVALQLADAVIAGLNAGVYSLCNWTFMDFPDYSKTYMNKWGMFRRSGEDYSTRAHYYGYGLLTRFFRGPSTVFKVDCDDPYVRVAAVQHHESDTWSIVVLSRYEGEVPFSVDLVDSGLNADFRKYVYDPADVPFHPFGDMQEPSATVSMREGRLTDRVGTMTLTVYTTAYDNEPPGSVQGVAATRTDDGKMRVQWEAGPATDLCYYRVYRGAGPDVELIVANQIGSTVATHFVDENPDPQAPAYVVVAVDRSGNAGPQR